MSRWNACDVRTSNQSGTIKFSPRLGLKSGHTTRVTPTNYCIQGSAGSKFTMEKGKEVSLMASQVLFVMLAVFGREREKTGKPLWICLWVLQRGRYGLTVHQRQHGARYIKISNKVRDGMFSDMLSSKERPIVSILQAKAKNWKVIVQNPVSVRFKWTN